MAGRFSRVDTASMRASGEAIRIIEETPMVEGDRIEAAELAIKSIRLWIEARKSAGERVRKRQEEARKRKENHER